MKRRAEVHFEIRGIRIRAQYQQGFVSWLKDNVPPIFREYESHSESWIIKATEDHYEFAKRVYEALPRFFHVIEEDDRSPTEILFGWDRNWRIPKQDSKKSEEDFDWEYFWDEGYKDTHYSKNYRNPNEPTQSQDNNSIFSRGGLSFDAAFAILELPIGSNAAAVKNAYRRMAILWHPDRNQHRSDEANTKMQEINRAYEFLKSSR